MKSPIFQSAPRTQRHRIYHSVVARLLATSVLCLMLLKPFPWIWRHFSAGRAKNMLSYWTYDMLWTFVRSGGTRVRSDPQVRFAIPSSLEPRVFTEQSFQLNRHDIQSFYEKGYLSPIRLCSPAEIRQLRDAIVEDVFKAGHTGEVFQQIPQFRPSRIYQKGDIVDRHLDSLAVLNLATQPGVLERVAQLLGPDLVIWRTQLFPKPPGAVATPWHQATTMTMTGKSLKPILEPDDPSQLFELNCWLALEDVDQENGCLRFWRGSHLLPIHCMKLKFGSTQGWYNYELDAEIPSSEIDDCELRAGEFVIFLERTIHSGYPNVSRTRRRFGASIRFCTPDVVLYRNIQRHVSNSTRDSIDVEHWTAVLARGEDRFQRNRMVTTADLRLQLLNYNRSQVFDRVSYQVDHAR